MPAPCSYAVHPYLNFASSPCHGRALLPQGYPSRFFLTSNFPHKQTVHSLKWSSVVPWASAASYARIRCSQQDIDVDVAVIGSGVLGISVAHSLLQADLEVAVIDRAEPGAGASATGAGQGYIWMGHRQPGTPGWDLGFEGKRLWKELVNELGDLAEEHPLGWQKTGSLLVAGSEAEAAALLQRVAALDAAGVRAEYLSAAAACLAEPGLSLPSTGGAALVVDDAQIDAALALACLRDRCRKRGGPDRYTELLHEPVLSINTDKGRVNGVTTAKRRIRARHKVVLAAGAWSGHLLSEGLQGQEDLETLPLIPQVQPRKGHLLVVEGPGLPSLRHALMECEYCTHYTPPSTPAVWQPPQVLAPSDEPVARFGPEQAGSERPDSKAVAWFPPSASEGLRDAVAVSMTVTTDPAGRLLIGSSREFSGFDSSISDGTILGIITRAAQFLPALEQIASTDGRHSCQVRTGLRPYVPDGKPLIGPVPGLPGLVLATGHEGSGLCMALATAELIRSYVLQEAPTLDPRPFLPDGRLVSRAQLRVTGK